MGPVDDGNRRSAEPGSRGHRARRERSRATGAHVASLGDLAALQALEEPWWRLLRADPRATPFQAPAWLLPWARRFAPDRTFAVTALRGSDLVALAPSFAWQGAAYLAGTGASDYGDALFAPGAEAEAGAVLAAICRCAQQRGCGSVDLQQLRAGSPLLCAPAPHGWLDAVEPGCACPVALLDADPRLACVSARWQRNLARAERLLRRDAGCEIALLPAADVAGAAAMLERLHARRWTGGGSVVFSDPLMRAFVADVLPSLAHAGLLRLQRVQADGRTIAAAWVMRCGGASHFYLCAFDPDWSRYSPGLLAILAAMRAAAADGGAEFHFLRGSEPYKAHFGARHRATFRRVLRPRPTA